MRKTNSWNREILVCGYLKCGDIITSQLRLWKDDDFYTRLLAWFAARGITEDEVIVTFEPLPFGSSWKEAEKRAMNTVIKMAYQYKNWYHWGEEK